MTETERSRAMTGRRRNPEAALQRAIVAGLRLALPPGAIVHHSAHEVRGAGRREQLAQAIGVGMGVHAGFPDLLVLAGGRVLFLEVKVPGGRLSAAQAAFRDAVRAQGLAWELVRSLEEALAALERHGLRARKVRCA